MTRTLFLSVALAALSSAAFANPNTSHVLNNQKSLADVFGAMDVTVHEVDTAASQAVAAGNTAAAQAVKANMNIESHQKLKAPVTAQASMDAQQLRIATTTANAVGNGLTATVTDGSKTVNAMQNAKSGAAVTANTTSKVRRSTVAAAGATAVANMAELQARNGASHAFVSQEGAADVKASVDAEACCTNTASASANASGAVINAVAENAYQRLDSSQKNNGQETTASVDLYVSGAENVVGAASATGTAINLSGARVAMDGAGYQENTASVKGESYVTVGGSWSGTAASSASGVGNQIVAQNRGADLNVNYTQNNTGRVETFAHLVGGNGGVGAVSATSIGNSFTGAVCTECGPANLHGQVSQTNSGAISAAGMIVMPTGAMAVGQSTAIGNSATFMVGPRN